ncbi:MAG: 4'-phosphopantetheinyl transferase superfamily protein [Symploca sp. SIO2E9]|nr:4'-phosphopantetheinyl transferase superfamily protein [Symploca sp. SIO2E9]
MDTVVEIVSKISGKKQNQISPKSTLRSLGITSSIEILKIQSALERKFNQKLSPIGDKWTINKIAAQVGQDQSNDEEVVKVAQSQTKLSSHETLNGSSERAEFLGSTGLYVGVDIEEIVNLPATSNYRTHDFYRSQFSNEELSSALLRPQPMMHLCGMFCAKEALKKSAPELIDLRMDEIKIEHQNGRPLIKTSHDSINSRFDFQVSISHSQHYAVATVLAVGR